MTRGKRKLSVKAKISGKSKKAKYGGRGRNWHPDFLKYAEKIVYHPNYAGMPGGIVEDGRIRWNAPSHRPPGNRWSNLHDERWNWWRDKALDIGIRLQGDWISRTAKVIHPYGKKPCQTCGRIMSIDYVYPTKNTTRKINRIDSISIDFDYYDFQSILEIVPEVRRLTGKDGLLTLAEILRVPKQSSHSVGAVKNYLKKNVIPSEPKGVLSPGAMADPPDRLDGFHSYNLCCRSKQDTGRYFQNLRTYNDDRRAFEWWCEGNWAAANYLMRQKASGKCPSCGRDGEFEPDHIGPISLGFTHRPRFRPLCGPCNSRRNNRMTYDDVRILVGDEREGDNVVSWQAQAIWDLYKGKVRNNQGALLLSKMMRVNQHHYLEMLWEINKAGYSGFLEQFLHLEYADNKYTVEGFNASDFSFKRLIPHLRHLTYATSKKKRYRRIAFKALGDYHSKTLRNVRMTESPKIEEAKGEVFASLKRGDHASARRAFKKYMKLVAKELVDKGVPRAHWNN